MSSKVASDLSRAFSKSLHIIDMAKVAQTGQTSFTLTPVTDPIPDFNVQNLATPNVNVNDPVKLPTVKPLKINKDTTDAFSKRIRENQQNSQSNTVKLTGTKKTGSSLLNKLAETVKNPYAPLSAKPLNYGSKAGRPTNAYVADSLLRNQGFFSRQAGNIGRGAAAAGAAALGAALLFGKKKVDTFYGPQKVKRGLLARILGGAALVGGGLAAASALSRGSRFETQRHNMLNSGGARANIVQKQINPMPAK